ncbi:MAG: hypothetical protein ACLR7Z_04295 [Bilophila wadsworthia]
MSIMDKSIASCIALLLGLFCLVLCAFLISLLQLLKMLSEEADETVNVALPNMAIASYISKESEWAKASSTTASCAATVSSTSESCRKSRPGVFPKTCWKASKRLPSILGSKKR